MSPARRPFLPKTNGPLEPVLALFSSVTLGVVLLVLLFVYSSIGSAGILYPTGWSPDGGIAWAHEQVRQWRGLEMTEFEWFHWWPFDLLIALICANVTIATLRRIPLTAVNYGVWLIHGGILILCGASVWYFSTKVEGDAPVVRRQVAIALPDGERGTMPAIPGNALELEGGDGLWSFRVSSIDPSWSILSGEDAGEEAFAVNVTVQGPDGMFVRQLLDGYPQYTEDVIRTGDPGQPMARAVKEIGRPLVDASLSMALEPAVQRHFYLANHIAKSWALYLREAGTRAWTQRPIEGLPLYNDYVGSVDEVWLEPGHEPPLDPIDVAIAPAEVADPLAGRDLRATAYLRYARLEERRLPGGERLDPVVRVRLREIPGGRFDYELVAFDPRRATDESGDVRFVWVESDAEREALAEVREPTLTIGVPDAGVEAAEVPVRRTLASDPDLDYTPLGDSGFAYRIEFIQDGIELPGGGGPHALASLQVRGPEGAFERWVFEDDRISVDMDPEPEQNEHTADDGHDHAEGDGHDHAHGKEPASPHDRRMRSPDPRLVTAFDAGFAPAPVTIVGGPADDDWHVLVPFGGEDPWRRVEPGDTVTLFETERATIEVDVVSAWARSRREVRPAVVPPHRRERDVRERLSMIKVHVPGAQDSVWVPYHHYPTRGRNDTLRRYAHRPAQVRLDDGRRIELVLSRERRPLPHPVRLDDFRLTTHVGGFSGRVSSIRDWTSVVSFRQGGGWSETRRVSMNQPAEYGELSFFQAEWDPPSGPRFPGDASSAGLNYTVLGVGNRHGVGLQLFGCTVAVIGMIYAFYFKPYVRRRQQALPRAARAEAGAPPSVDPMPVLDR